MFVVVSGTSRPGANSLKVARLVQGALEEAGAATRLLDLAELPAAAFRPEALATRPPEFTPYQEAIDECAGVLVVVAEYNGSFPGVLKHFLDLLRYPGSLEGVPSAFVGLSGGRWGGLRAVEQLQQVFQYGKAHLFPQRVFLSHVYRALDGEGRLVDPELAARLRHQAATFVEFAGRNPRRPKQEAS